MRVRDSEKVLPAVRPNAGTAALFRKRLREVIEKMERMVVRAIAAAYRRDPPATIAQDAARTELRQALSRMRQRWDRSFATGARRLADYFAEDVQDRSEAALRAILKDAGFAVTFRMTREMRDVLGATVQANVSLIRSIPRRYLDEVEGAVMRSVQTGRDLEQLTDDIVAIGKSTRKRAELIARDQNNKATGAIVEARQRELGIRDAVWMHSHAGKTPRPTHVAMNGKRFRIADGMYDKAEGRNVKPGELINCRCTARPIVPGLT